MTAQVPASGGSNTHSKKSAALLAYDLGVLSDAGRARVEKHLATCALCARELAAIRVYEALQTEAKAQQWADPNWDRMDLALRREASAVASAIRQERAGGRAALYGALAAAAVILLAVGTSGLWPRGGAPARVRSAAEELALRDGAPRSGTVTAVAGHATVDARVVALGDEIREGALIVTSPNSATHVRLADGTGFLLAASTTARLERSREHGTVIALEAGRVTNRVAHLEAGARYEIAAAPYVIHVRGTHFTVSHGRTAAGEAEVTVTVKEGVVEVTEGDALVARIVGPNRWSAPEEGAARHPGWLEDPVALAPGGADWPVVTIPRTEGVVSVEFDGLPLSLAGEVAMRASVGTHQGVAFDLSGTATRFTLEVGPEGASLDPTLMLRPTVVDAPRRGSLDPEIVRDVVTRGMDGVQRCYQTALMRRPDLAGHMALRITVDPSGHVARATLATSATPYPWLSTCVENQAGAWVFPAPEGGAAVSLSVPLDFATR